MAFMEQWHGRHTQQWLLEFPLLIICFRGIGGPQSNSQKVSVSQSFTGVLLCSRCCVTTVPDCDGRGTPTSTSEVQHASKLSGVSCTDTVVSVTEARDVDMLTNARTCVKRDCFVLRGTIQTSPANGSIEERQCMSEYVQELHVPIVKDVHMLSYHARAPVARHAYLHDSCLATRDRSPSSQEQAWYFVEWQALGSRVRAEHMNTRKQGV